MTFQAPKTIPGLETEPNRALVKAFGDIENDLTALGEFSVTQIQTGNYVATVGELVRVSPPAAGLKVLLPLAQPANQGLALLVAIESVASGGTVVLAVTGGTQTVNNAATMTVTVAGLVLAYSTGTQWVCTVLSAGGGGAGTWAATLALGATSGANNPIVDVGQFLQLGLAGVATGQIRSGDAVFTIRGANTMQLAGNGGVLVSSSGGAITLSANTSITLISGGVNRVIIASTGEWTTPAGASGQVWTHQGAGVPPIWAAAGGGSDPRIFAWWGV